MNKPVRFCTNERRVSWLCLAQLLRIPFSHFFPSLRQIIIKKYMTGASASICCLSFKSNILYAECIHKNNDLESLHNFHLHDSETEI